MFQFTGDVFTNWLLAILGNVFLLILVYRAVGHYARNEKGELLGHVALGILVAGFVYMPTQVVGIFKGAFSLITQGHV